MGDHWGINSLERPSPWHHKAVKVSQDQTMIWYDFIKLLEEFQSCGWGKYVIMIGLGIFRSARND